METKQATSSYLVQDNLKIVQKLLKQLSTTIGLSVPLEAADVEGKLVCRINRTLYWVVSIGENKLSFVPVAGGVGGQVGFTPEGGLDNTAGTLDSMKSVFLSERKRVTKYQVASALVGKAVHRTWWQGRPVTYRTWWTGIPAILLGAALFFGAGALLETKEDAWVRVWSAAIAVVTIVFAIKIIAHRLGIYREGLRAMRSLRHL